MPRSRSCLPPLEPARPRGTVADLIDLCHNGFAVLTGAGVSTASGIPDYRGVTGRRRPASPMSHQDFVSDAVNRQRYWARSMVGWRLFNDTEPNAAHKALARLQQAGVARTIITQNVDGLHQQAGAQDVIELHGTLATVRCLDCDDQVGRAWLQDQLAAANPDWIDRTAATSADGDAHITDVSGFTVVGCPSCGGVLMPNVVFFGAGAPRERVDRCYTVVEQAPALLVVGTSLHVWSGLRFVRRAAAAGRPVAIVNHGTTRADELATVRLDTDLVAVLATLASQLAPRGDTAIDPTRPLSHLIPTGTQ